MWTGEKAKKKASTDCGETEWGAVRQLPSDARGLGASCNLHSRDNCTDCDRDLEADARPTPRRKSRGNPEYRSDRDGGSPGRGHALAMGEKGRVRVTGRRRTDRG